MIPDEPRREGDVVSELATEAAKPFAVGAAEAYVVANGAARVLDLERMLSEPRRQRGTVEVFDELSFTRYVDSHSTAATSSLWSDWRAGTLVCVLNGHEKGTPEDVALAGWCDHRVNLKVRSTPTWDRWGEVDGKWLTQEDLAEHINSSLDDFVDPTGADMLQLALTLEAHHEAQFRSATVLQSGARRFAYDEDVSLRGSAGASGVIDMPKTLRVRLQPWENGELFGLDCELRYRLKDGQLTLMLSLLRLEEAKRDAFSSMASRVADHTNLPLHAGTPQGPVMPGSLWQ